MKITDLNIEGFGVWHNLNLPDISPRLTAFYGANEAGKTTLMQFVRAILYGMSPERRERYLPPQEGGRPGGSLTLADSQQHFCVNRIAAQDLGDLGRVTISWPDRQDSGAPVAGDRLLREALGEVDESTFSNLFAIGLGEIQRLATLSGTQAAQALYRLTSGLDRVSLYDVIQGLRQTRTQLIQEIGLHAEGQAEAPSGQPAPRAVPEPGQAAFFGASRGPERGGQTPRDATFLQDSLCQGLVLQRDRLRGRIDALKEQNRQWSQWAVRFEEFDRRMEEIETQVDERQHAARTIEIAVGLKSNWRRRSKLTGLIQQLGGGTPLPEDAIERLETLQEKKAGHQRKADILQGQRHQLRDEVERLGVNELMVQNACRIDALGEQRDWLQALERQTERLAAEAEETAERLASEQTRLSSSLGLSSHSGALREISEGDLKSLRPLVQALQETERCVDQAQEELVALSQNEQSLQLKLESASSRGEQHGLPMDVQEASNLVANLRKRLQVEQRIEQAQAHALEMESQSHELLNEQIMPLWLFGLLLTVFVLGALMVGLWLLVPSAPLGSMGGLLALLGVGGAGFSWMFKFFAEDAAADRLDACHRQIELADKQLQESRREKEHLDGELAMVDGSVVLRLQAAERHLAALENLLPVETERKVALHETTGARQRLQVAQEKQNRTLADWKTRLVALGLPTELDYRLLTKVTDRYGKLSNLEQQVQARLKEVEDRRREHDALTRRIRAIAEEVGCVLEEARDGQPVGREEGSENPDTAQASALDQLDHLLSERRKQFSRVEQRKKLREQAKSLKAEEGRHRRAVAGLNRRLAALWESAECEDETAYRARFEQQRKVARHRKQRKVVSREIAAAIGQHEPEETFTRLLRPQTIDRLETLWEEATAKLEASQQELKKLAGQRGEMKQKLSALAEDRALAEAILDLDGVQQQLSAAQDRWREYATVSRMLERIRDEYEAHRQPEALHEASTLLGRMTAGKYQRIWTPLANDILLVETASGQSLPIEALSRGTREQLLLSVRLALVTLMARRGVKLPMVLDDVLVNFDAVRARQAAEVLLEFAAAGHQVLLFTCHEHVWQMFRELKADCRRLPRRAGAQDPEENPALAPVPESEPAAAGATEVAPLPSPPPRPKKKKKRQKKSPPPQPPTTRMPEPLQSESPPLKPAATEPAASEPVVPEPVVIEATVPANEFSYDWAYHLTSRGESDRSAGPEDEHVLAYVLSGEVAEESTKPRRA